MEIPRRKAVSPIIATLLLIAIAVASGVIVYVFVGSLAGSLTKSGGTQVTEQVSMDAYNYQAPPVLTVYLRNTGTGTVNMTSFFVDGVKVSPTALTSTSGTSCMVHNSGGSPSVVVCAPGGTVSAAFSQASTSGLSHTVKIVTSDGAQFTFNVVAGQTG